MAIQVKYDHRCKNDDCPVGIFESDEMRDAPCPECGQPAKRIFGDVINTFHPTRSVYKGRSWDDVFEGRPRR